MVTRQNFLRKLESSFRDFDKNIFYITNSLEEEFIHKKRFIRGRLTYIKSNLQDAFEIYKKIKYSPEETGGYLRALASRIFNNLVKEFTILNRHIKKQKMGSNSFRHLKNDKNLLTNLKFHIEKHPSISIFTALSVGFTFGKLVKAAKLYQAK